MVTRNVGIDRRQEMKQALLHRTQDSHEHRDDTGMYGDIFLEIEGLQKFKCSPSVHLIDIIPYKAGDKDPHVKEGQWTYFLDVFVHGSVGVNQNSYICLARTYNQLCPICEHREETRSQEDYDEEYVKNLYPIRRVIYNIVCYDDPKQEAKGIQVWIVAHFHMEKKLMAIAKLPARGGSGGGYVSFTDPDEGRSIQFERKGGKTNTEYLGHQFILREGYTISEDILTAAYQLDQIIYIPTYDEIKEVFFVGNKGGEEEFEKVSDKSEPVKEQPTKEELATSQSSRLIRRGNIPLNQSQPTLTEEQCPYGGKFGIDCEDLKACGNCETWDNCSAKKDELRAKATSTPEPLAEPVKPSRPTPVPTGARRGMIPRR